MSADKKSVHVRLTPEAHGKLAVLAEAEVKDAAELAAVLLEKAVIGEFHAFSMAVNRLNRLGLSGSKR